MAREYVGSFTKYTYNEKLRRYLPNYIVFTIEACFQVGRFKFLGQSNRYRENSAVTSHSIRLSVPNSKPCKRIKDELVESYIETPKSLGITKPALIPFSKCVALYFVFIRWWHQSPLEIFNLENFNIYVKLILNVSLEGLFSYGKL